MDWLNDIVSEHPGLFLLVLAGANAALGWFSGTLKWFVKREFRLMEEHQGRQDERIDAMQQRLNRYDVSFGISQEAFEGLVKTIEDHLATDRETIRKLDELCGSVAHIEGMLERNGGG